MLRELFRLSNRLVWFATFAHDLGAITPNFYTFVERERILDIVELITGGRLHPEWLRLGGAAADLPEGWKEAVDELVYIFPGRLREYEKLVGKNLFSWPGRRGSDSSPSKKPWTGGSADRICALAGSNGIFRKKCPIRAMRIMSSRSRRLRRANAIARYLVRVEEMRQSIRIIEQVAANMPPGRYVRDDYRYVIPRRSEMLRDIETLIHHFINVTRGMKIPRGRSLRGHGRPQRRAWLLRGERWSRLCLSHARTGAGFANVQTLPLLATGESIADLIAIIGSIDIILPDIDR